MEYEVDPSKYHTLWDTKTRPEKNDYRFTLLVDLSGSMFVGGKITKTFRGTVLLAEALERAGVKVEILGFQDELIIFKAFNEPLNQAVRDRMAGMPAEVTNANPGGHNKAAHNDDGFCVDAAAKRLAAQEGTQRFLVVLSDGTPVPSSAHRGRQWDLHRIIQEIRERREVKLVGVGLGPGTDHVKTFYPNHAVMEEMQEFPENMVGLFEDLIINPNRY